MSRHLSISPSLHPSITAIALLLILAWLQLSSLAVTSPTMDEPSHLASGYAFLTRGDARIRLNGPILPNLIGAIPLLLQPDLKLTPADDPMWDQNDHNGISDQFVWSNTVSPFRIIYLARFPFIAIGWLLGALIFRWAKERNGAGAGAFALALFVFDPNLLAHSRFVMTDFEPTAIACFTLHAFDRWRRQLNDRKWLIMAGIGLGLTLASKFSLIMIALAVAILYVVDAFTAKAQSYKEHIKGTLGLSVFVAKNLLILFALAALSVWTVYAFQIAPVDAGGSPVPAPGFWREWESAQYYLNQPWPNYLFGQTSQTGWWYYFPIAFALKTPLPMLILLILALARTIIKRTWRNDAIFLLPAFLIFFSLLFSTNNLGYRYLLPVLPLIFVYVSGLIPRVIALSLRPSFAVSPSQLVVWLAVPWQVVSTLGIYPYYLTYFNEIAGGPERGRYILSDSNIDWGQDLVGLKNYVDHNKIARIKLSYFGIAHPTAYNFQTEALPPVRTAMTDQGAWWLDTYYSFDPPPGKYAISIANLMGGIWIDPSEYAYFRDRQPDTAVGNSIYLYTIAPRGEPANLSLSGLQIDQIDPETYRRFNTNDVRPRWFDATSSLIAAPNEAWIAIADNQVIAPEFVAFFDGAAPVGHAKLTNEDRSYTLYHFDLGQRMMEAAQQSEQKAQAVQLPVKFGDTAELIGYRLERAGQSLSLITYWRAGDHVIPPLQMFVHVIDPDSSIVAQVDRLDASPFGWRAGDMIAQLQHVSVPRDAPIIAVAIGLYNPDSGQRLLFNAMSGSLNDQLLLSIDSTLP